MHCIVHNIRYLINYLCVSLPLLACMFQHIASKLRFLVCFLLNIYMKADFRQIDDRLT